MNVQELFIEGKVLKFLGGVIDVEEDINENQLRKAERNKSFKPIRTAFNDDDELQAIQSSLPDLPNLHNCHRILYKSVVTRETREMANANSPVLFINSNGEVSFTILFSYFFCIFKIIFLNLTYEKYQN